MIGDQQDMLARLQSLIPPGWLGDDDPIAQFCLNGVASVMSFLYGLIQYARRQTRRLTSSDGFIDLSSLDLFGGTLPRAPGETDPQFNARITANLFQPANTKAGIAQRLFNVTGFVPRIMQPWCPGDCAVLDCVTYYDVDTAENPGRIGAPELAATFFVETQIAPLVSIGNAPAPAYDAVACLDTWTAPLIDLGQAGLQSETNVYNAVAAAEVLGVTGWVKFVGQLTTPQFWDSGLAWDTPGLTWPF